MRHEKNSCKEPIKVLYFGKTENIQAASSLKNELLRWRLLRIFPAFYVQMAYETLLKRCLS